MENRFLDLTPVLYTTRLDESIQFYCDVLGFTLTDKMEELGWASLQKDQIGLMFSKPNEHLPFEKEHFTGSFYFRVDDAESLWNLIKDRIQVCYAPEKFEWGMLEFALYDPNGYVIQFGSSC